MAALTVHPADGVHTAAVGPDLVVLDLNAGAYLCLPGLAERLGPLAEGAFAADDRTLVDQLVQSGLFSRTPGPDRLRPPPLPPRRTSRAAVVGLGRPREAAQFSSAVLFAERTFHAPRLKALIARSRRGRGRGRGPHAPDDRALVRRAVLFDRWLPWAPRQGQCLYRAYTLRRFLGSDGLDAAWVFGVRTWPFSAHCWLQAGDLLLDDDLDRVGLYTPILAA